MVEKVIKVKAANKKSYLVYIGSNILKKRLAKLINPKFDEVFWVVDKMIYELQPKLFLGLNIKQTNLYLVTKGEASKNLAELSELMLFLTTKGITRKSLIIAIGGGVVCDLAGFCAAIILRGVQVIMVPTTLLSQVDASIGGKNGVNLATGKNLVGTIYPPFACIHEYQFLTSLKSRDLVSGFAEILKHALIKDKKLFDYLKQKNPKDLLKDKAQSLQIIYQSCLIKALVVQKDELETGLRAMLNFGHTTGHFIEQASGYTKFRHGECVLAGMGFASFLSTELKGLSLFEHNQITDYILSFFKPILLPKKLLNEFEKVVGRDKKTQFKTVKFVALTKIGKADFIFDLEIKTLKKYFIKYSSLKNSLIKLV